MQVYPKLIMLKYQSPKPPARSRCTISTYPGSSGETRPWRTAKSTATSAELGFHSGRSSRSEASSSSVRSSRNSSTSPSALIGTIPCGSRTSKVASTLVESPLLVVYLVEGAGEARMQAVV